MRTPPLVERDRPALFANGARGPRWLINLRPPVPAPPRALPSATGDQLGMLVRSHPV
jgi:hypothetical protein